MSFPTHYPPLEGRKEFAVRRDDGLVTINYVVQMPGTFDGIRADFRGITFDEATGQCVSPPLHKFFNVNQTPGTMFPAIRNRQSMIFEKLDGSLIHFMRHRGEILAASRMGPGTDHALAAFAFAKTSRKLGAIAKEVDDGWTPIFEFCSPKYPIVVRHPMTRLVYLCSRCRASGEYTFNGEYADRAAIYSFRFSDIMAELEHKQDFEGYVCWLDDGTVVKAKCNWYLARHRAFDVLLRPAYKLYGMALEGVMDDVIAAAASHHKGPLEQVYEEAQTDFLAETERLQLLARAIEGRSSGATQGVRRRGQAAVARGRRGLDEDLRQATAR